jgi:hypothetical protein
VLGTQLLLCAAHAAAPATVGPVVITVPEGFAPAQTQKLRKTLITAWTKSARGGAGSLKTLLQINVIDFGTPPGKPTAPADLERYAEKYLRQSLDAIQLRRTDYTSSPSAHITLAGLPAVRATWNGALAGRATVGVMYSVIVKSRYAVIFHTQDLGSTPSSGMFEAMQAIEAVTLSEPSAPSAAAAASSGMS